MASYIEILKEIVEEHTGHRVLLSEVSQSKKIRKYIDMSVILKWYEEKAPDIAKALGVEVSDLASIDTILKETTGLISHVINSQTGGNEGNQALAGFSDFRKLENNIAHDVFHNIYHVTQKNFRRSLGGHEYDESELFEEIEILALEETFMKHIGVRHVPSDFINQNLNQLASYICFSILENDPERVINFLENDAKPYLMIYGKKYELDKNNPFYGIFEAFTESFEGYGRVRDEEGLKNAIIHYLNIGEGIDRSNGDRANYPDGDFYGNKDFYDLDEEEMEQVIKNNDVDVVEEKDTDGGISEGKIVKVDLDETSNISAVDVFEQYLQHSTGEYYILPKKLIGQLKDNLDEEIYREMSTLIKRASTENVLYYKGLFLIGAAVPTTIKEWKLFDEKANREVATYIVGGKTYHWKGDVGSAFTQLEDDYLDSGTAEYYHYDNDHEFINFEGYRKKTLKELIKELYRNPNAASIFRRNFRANDMVRNNTSFGNLEQSYYSSVGVERLDREGEAEHVDIEQKDLEEFGGKTAGYEVTRPKDKFTFTDFMGSYDYPSISKNTFTDNGKKLVEIFDMFRGYAIKHFKEIKANWKEYRDKFSKIDREAFSSISGQVADPKSLASFILAKFPEYLLVETGDVDYITKNFINIIEQFSNLQGLALKIKSDEDIKQLLYTRPMKRFYSQDQLKQLFDFFKSKNFIKHLRMLKNIMNNNKKEIEFVMGTDYNFEQDWRNQFKEYLMQKRVIVPNAEEDYFPTYNPELSEEETIEKIGSFFVDFMQLRFGFDIEVVKLKDYYQYRRPHEYIHTYKIKLSH